MPVPFKGTINLDIRESKPDWESFLDRKAPKDAPNVLVILYDDTGQALKTNPSLKAPMIEAAAEVEEQVIEPLFQFCNYGQQLPHHWSMISNESAFGTDYFTRTAIAKSNILVNSPLETKYYYQDLDATGERLNGARRYAVTFPKDQTKAGGRRSNEGDSFVGPNQRG